MKLKLKFIISFLTQTKEAMLHLHLHTRGKWISHYSPPNLHAFSNHASKPSPCVVNKRAPASKLKARNVHCNARRRVRYEESDEDEDEEYGYNEEIAMLEVYSQSARGEALLVRAKVDGQEELVLVFKGFSSSLTYGTAPDPSKSVLPERAIIKSIDRIKGPFDPSHIEYIEPGLTWDAFRNRIRPE